MSDVHRGYKVEVEEAKKQKEKVMLDMPVAGQSVIDDWSAEAKANISDRKDFENWVDGMIKLYRTQRGES